MKKTILHIIDDLGRGGAETMLIAVLKQLHEYNNVVVTLYNRNQFGDELQCDAFYCLELKSVFLTPLAGFKLKSIVRRHNVDIVHSHLFWSTVTARIGVPKNIPLITTVHSFVASSLEYKPWSMRFIDRLSFRIRPTTIVTVAKGALQEYIHLLKATPYRAKFLHTFVDTSIFIASKNQHDENRSRPMRLVSVGNLKAQKNQQFLLDAFYDMNDPDIHLDIYGEGPLQETFQQFIDAHQLNITLKGQANNLPALLPGYDLFVMSSIYEGFALSVLEAMATEVPMLLSDIPSFKEQCGETALYFDLSSIKTFITALQQLKTQPDILQQMKAPAKQRVADNFTLQHYMSGLRNIYTEAVSQS